MIYYSLKSLLLGVLLSILLGALLSVLSVALDTVFDCLGTLLRLPRDVIKASENKAHAKEYFKCGISVRGETRGAWLVFKDALFLILSGFLASLLLYLAVDGEIRIYVLLIVFASYTVFRKSFGELLHGLLTKVARLLLTVISAVLFASAFLVRFCLLRAVFTVKKIRIPKSKRKTKDQHEKSKSKIVQIV